MYIIIFCDYRAPFNRKCVETPPVRLSVLARIVSFAKYRKNTEQKWLCVQPPDHWRWWYLKDARSIHHCACTSMAGSVLCALRKFGVAQTRGILLCTPRFAQRRKVVHMSAGRRSRCFRWESVTPFPPGFLLQLFYIFMLSSNRKFTIKRHYAQEYYILFFPTYFGFYERIKKEK